MDTRRRRRRRQFKPSFLNPETEAKATDWAAGEPREVITKPLDVDAKNLIPWMNAYNPQNREVVLHQATLRAKARNSQNQLPALSTSPLDLKPEGFVMKRSMSQPLLAKVPSSDSRKPPISLSTRMSLPEITIRPKLFVKGQSSISDRKSEQKALASHSAPTGSPLVYTQKRKLSPVENPEKGESVFKYFNAGVIPERTGKKVTISDVRAYIAYMEKRHFR